MEVIGWIILLFAGMRLGVSFFNWAAQPYLPAVSTDKPQMPPLLSILVPVRNEEKNLPYLLEDLQQIAYPDLEILLYDDCSTDKTAAIVQEAAQKTPRIQLIRGKELPIGWTGKNHACHCLAQAARGQLLLFLDADVRIGKEVPARAAHYLHHNSLGLLSIFPRQIMPGPGTRAVVPLMNWILLTLLPLPLIRTAPQKSLAAANGQFMLFDAARYRRLLPHRACRRNPVEDIAILQLYKERGLKAATLLGNEDVSCRMYRTLPEAVNGFSKNLFRFFGGSALTTFLFAAITTAGFPWIYYFNGPAEAGIYLGIVLLIRLFVSLASRQPVFWNLLLMVPQQGALWLIFFKALRNRFQKQTLWKGRNVFPGSERNFRNSAPVFPPDPPPDL